MTVSSVAVRLVALGVLSLPLAGCLLPLPIEMADERSAAPASSAPVASATTTPGDMLSLEDLPVSRPGLAYAAAANPDDMIATPVALSGTAAVGMASYYGRELHGRRKANGELFDMNELTAAHRTWPFGTMVRVTNLSNGKSVVVRISDRGPFARGRVIDVSLAAAKELDFVRRGVTKVRIDKL
ncbi:MAG: septal ring lytic transglycosylase RlpA family protein [Labrys sp. (in: a-proteobacteria)]|jgi:rare lipoprotein A